MSVCGARTWVGTPIELVTCTRNDGHDGPHGGSSALLMGSHTWDTPRLHHGRHVFSPTSAREIIASLQRQLDALDPDAAIAEAERRMVEAFRYYVDLRRIRSELLDTTDEDGELGALGAAVSCAASASCAARSVWVRIVEARDAKDGGA